MIVSAWDRGTWLRKDLGVTRIVVFMPLSDELLLGFYERGEPDVQGRTHASILGWSDAVLEAVHDYIQWLFPLPEVSGANPSAPLMTPRVRQAFHASAEMRGR